MLAGRKISTLRVFHFYVEEFLHEPGRFCKQPGSDGVDPGGNHPRVLKPQHKRSALERSQGDFSSQVGRVSLAVFLCVCACVCE